MRKRDFFSLIKSEFKKEKCQQRVLPEILPISDDSIPVYFIAADKRFRAYEDVYFLLGISLNLSLCSKDDHSLEVFVIVSRPHVPGPRQHGGVSGICKSAGKFARSKGVIALLRWEICTQHRLVLCFNAHSLYQCSKHLRYLSHE